MLFSHGLLDALASSQNRKGGNNRYCASNNRLKMHGVVPHGKRTIIPQSRDERKRRAERSLKFQLARRGDFPSCWLRGPDEYYHRLQFRLLGPVLGTQECRSLGDAVFFGCRFCRPASGLPARYGSNTAVSSGTHRLKHTGDVGNNSLAGLMGAPFTNLSSIFTRLILPKTFRSTGNIAFGLLTRSRHGIAGWTLPLRKSRLAKPHGQSLNASHFRSKALSVQHENEAVELSACCNNEKSSRSASPAPILHAILRLSTIRRDFERGVAAGCDNCLLFSEYHFRSCSVAIWIGDNSRRASASADSASLSHSSATPSHAALSGGLIILSAISRAFAACSRQLTVSSIPTNFFA